MKLVHDFIIYWESYLPSGRDRILTNVRCAGWTKINAKSVDDARHQWNYLFPKDKIVKII